jgi:hypothetical protein
MSTAQLIVLLGFYYLSLAFYVRIGTRNIMTKERQGEERGQYMEEL